MKPLILIFSFLVISIICYCQENIIVPRTLNDTLKLDSLIRNGLLDYLIKDIDTNRLKDKAVLPGTYEEFKRKFLALKLDNEPIDIGLPKAKPGIPQLLDDNYIKSLGFALNSPISFLYYNFSKVERSKRKHIRLRYESEEYAKIDKKFNRHKIQYWTGLKEKELDKFILFCHFSLEYLLTSNEYDIILKIKEKLVDFKKAEELKLN